MENLSLSPLSLSAQQAHLFFSLPFLFLLHSPTHVGLFSFPSRPNLLFRPSPAALSLSSVSSSLTCGPRPSASSPTSRARPGLSPSPSSVRRRGFMARTSRPSGPPYKVPPEPSPLDPYRCRRPRFRPQTPIVPPCSCLSSPPHVPRCSTAPTESLSRPEAPRQGE